MIFNIVYHIIDSEIVKAMIKTGSQEEGHL